MRVVLDTNVLIAAFATRGLCQDLFELCLQETEMILSEVILKELQKVFSRKIKLPQPQIQAICKFLLEQGRMVKPAKIRDALNCRDQTDIAILATAQAGEAQFLITGDQDLLTLKSFHGIQILSPRKFWTFLASRKA